MTDCKSIEDLEKKYKKISNSIESGVHSVTSIHVHRIIDSSIDEAVKIATQQERGRSSKIISLAISMLNAVGCFQGCDGSGAIQLSEDEVIQCQWCDELRQIKAYYDEIVKGE